MELLYAFDAFRGLEEALRGAMSGLLGYNVTIILVSRYSTDNKSTETEEAIIAMVYGTDGSTVCVQTMNVVQKN